MFRQADLLSTLEKLVEAEAQALAQGKSRKEAIYAAYERFYRGDIAEEIVRATQASGGLITMEDLDRWQVRQEVIAHEEAHEDEVVDDLLEVIPARHPAPVRADELLVQVLAQHPDLA